MSNIETLNTKYKAEVAAGVERYAQAGKLPDIAPKFVIGDGSGTEPVMLIGEAPGKEEVRYGKAFVGPAGKILSELLERSGLDRNELYITNTVKYRLARHGRRAGTLANRPVKSFEIALCGDWLRDEILEIAPRLILTLGNTALTGVLRHTEGYDPRSGSCNDDALTVGALHGRQTEITIGGLCTVLIPLYHPASLIYNPQLRTEYYADLEVVKQCVQSILS